MPKRIVALGLALALLLAGCSLSNPTPTAPSSLPDPLQETQLLEQMTRQAEAYETVYALWNQDTVAFSDAMALAGNWLLLNHPKQMEPYRVTDGGPIPLYETPREQLSEVWELLAGQPTPPFWNGETPEGTSEDVWGLVDMSITLKLMDSQIDYAANGQATRAILDFARYQTTDQGLQWIYPARYTLVPHEIEAVPQLLEGAYQPGDLLWRVEQYETVTSLEQLQAFDPTVVTTLLHYSIRTPEDLVEMSRRINSLEFQEVQASYRLENDLDMTGISWVPAGIGPSLSTDRRSPRAPGFCGTFDGQGYTIRNLTLEDTSLQKPEQRSNAFGLFAQLSANATVENLKIENASFTLHESIDPCGIVAGSSSGTIRNCQVSGTVTGFGPLGGIVGMAEDAQLLDCTADVSIEGSMDSGGLVGSATDTRLENCTVTGKLSFVPFVDSVLTEPLSMGGLAGYYITLSESLTLVNCVADMAFDAAGTTPQACGAFLGLAAGAVRFENCSYTGRAGLPPLGEREFDEQLSTDELTLVEK